MAEPAFYKEKWSDLTPQEQQIATQYLARNESNWETNLFIQDWDELTEDQQLGARLLGMTQDRWDNEMLPITRGSEGTDVFPDTGERAIMIDGVYYTEEEAMKLLAGEKDENDENVVVYEDDFEEDRGEFDSFGVRRNVDNRTLSQARADEIEVVDIEEYMRPRDPFPTGTDYSEPVSSFMPRPETPVNAFYSEGIAKAKDVSLKTKGGVSAETLRRLAVLREKRKAEGKSVGSRIKSK